jgi:DNA-binding CsgD family transcriptional regulator
MTWNSEAAERLTPKERECLGLVRENRSSKEIARQLGISNTSVDTHIRRALAKLNLRDRYEAARLLAQLERPESALAAAPSDSSRQAGFRWSDLWMRIGALIPPMERLGIWQRMVLVVAVAILMALIFGIVLNAMRTL